jgi:hypothetical protein
LHGFSKSCSMFVLVQRMWYWWELINECLQWILHFKTRYEEIFEIVIWCRWTRRDYVWNSWMEVHDTWSQFLLGYIRCRIILLLSRNYHLIGNSIAPSTNVLFIVIYVCFEMYMYVLCTCLLEWM